MEEKSAELVKKALVRAVRKKGNTMQRERKAALREKKRGDQGASPSKRVLR